MDDLEYDSFGDTEDQFSFSDYSNGWGQQSYAPDSFMGQNYFGGNDGGQQSYAPSDFDSMDFLQQQNQFDVPPDTQWGSQSYAPGSAMFNVMQQSSPGMSLPNAGVEMAPVDQGMNWDGIQNTLAGLFNNKGLMTGLGALMEGYQNKKKAGSTQDLVRQQQARLDPFGSQRPQYQQELSRTMRDPYSAPIVRDQVAQIQKAQAIKDAAAGRRSNQATSNPAMLAAQAQIAQDYMKSLYTPAGANIAPQDGGGLQALMQGNNANVQGYISPIMSALGMNAQTNSNNQSQQELLSKLQELLAGAR